MNVCTCGNQHEKCNKLAAAEESNKLKQRLNQILMEENARLREAVVAAKEDLEDLRGYRVNDEPLVLSALNTLTAALSGEDNKLEDACECCMASAQSTKETANE